MPVIINGTTGVTFPNGVTMSDGTSAPVTIAQGGTGANTAANARTALGTNDAANLTTGTLPDARFPATLPAASGANLTSLNASNLSSGTVGTARLASGTANNTTFLRGDQTWQVVSTTPANGSITDPMIADVSGAGTVWAPFGVPNMTCLDVDSTASTIKGSDFRALRGGTFRFRFVVYSDNPTGSTRTYNVYLYKNGVLASTVTFTQANGSFSETSRTLPDITVARGDVISLYGQMNGSGTTMRMLVYGGQYGTSTTTASLSMSLLTWPSGSLYQAL
jgi:hypothetical protein